MVNLFLGHRLIPQVTTFTMPGLLLFGLIVTYVFTDRLTAIVRDREKSFLKLQQAYRELEMARPLARLGRSIATVNHEIKHKTYNLSLILKSLKRIPLQPSVRDQIDECNSAVETIARFSRDVLEQSGLSEVHKERVDLYECIKALTDASCRKWKNLVRCDCPASGLVVLADAIKLHCVFENLFNNSAQAGATIIHVRLRKNDRVIVVAVEDNGIGCDQKTLDSLFTAFFTTKIKQHGTGLGLSIAQTIAENHGGRMSAYSKNLLGNSLTGMIFTIILPLNGTKTENSKKPNDANAMLIVREGLDGCCAFLEKILRNVEVNHKISSFEEIKRMKAGRGQTIICNENIAEMFHEQNIVSVKPVASMIEIVNNNNAERFLFTEETAVDI